MTSAGRKPSMDIIRTGLASAAAVARNAENRTNKNARTFMALPSRDSPAALFTGYVTVEGQFASHPHPRFQFSYYEDGFLSIVLTARAIRVARDIFLTCYLLRGGNDTA